MMSLQLSRPRLNERLTRSPKRREPLPVARHPVVVLTAFGPMPDQKSMASHTGPRVVADEFHVILRSPIDHPERGNRIRHLAGHASKLPVLFQQIDDETI